MEEKSENQTARFEIVGDDDLDALDEIVALGIFVADQAVAMITAGKAGQMHPAGVYHKEQSSIMTADGRPATAGVKCVGMVLPWNLAQRTLQVMADLEAEGIVDEVRRKLQVMVDSKKH